MTEIYQIHPANLRNLEIRLSMMQKRARKLGLYPITIEVVGEIKVEVSRLMPGGRYQMVEEPRIQMRVHGEAPVLAGWTLVAKVEWLEGERLISCVPGEGCPEEYRTGKFTCDHCNLSRQRKEVFVLRNGNEYKQIGRNCLQDFLGGVSPEQLMAAAKYIFTALNEASECEREGGRYVSTTFGITQYLNSVAICIRRLGWASKGAVLDGESSTSGDAWHLLDPPAEGRLLRDYNEWVESNDLVYQDRDKEQAEAALAWAIGLDTAGNNDYIYNLGVACRAGYVTRKTMGLVASAIVAHAHHLEREEEISRRNRERKPSVHVGEIKNREVFKGLKVRTMRYLDSNWGTITLVIFEDASGSILKWFASKALNDLHEGDTVNLKATVKKHEEYNGVPQTVVTRGVIQD